MLIRLAEMLKRVIDRNVPGCFAGRWGGEEFMVLLPGVDLERADTVAEIMRQEFNKLEFELCGHQTMSLGVAELIPGENPDVFTMRVDDALYHAKGKGKNRVERA